MNDLDPRCRGGVLALTLLAALLPLCGDQPQTSGIWLLELPVLAAVAMLWRLPAPAPSFLLRLGALWVAWIWVCSAPHIRWAGSLIERQGLWTSMVAFSNPTTVDETYALRRAVDALTALLLALGVFRLARQRLANLVRPAQGLAVGAVLTSAYGLAVYGIQLARGGPLDWPAIGSVHLGGADVTLNTVVFSPRLSSFFGNPGWFAQFAVLTLPVLLLAMHAGPRRVRRWAAGGLLLQLTSLLLTWSRAAWVAAGVALVLFIWKIRPLSSRARTTLWTLIGTGTAALAAAAIILGVGQPFARDITWVRLTGEAGWGERLDLWLQALMASSAAPLFGHGAGGFHRFYAAAVPPWSPDWQPLHGTAHSLWFETLTASGWPGLVLVVLFCGVGLAMACSTRADESRENRLVRAAAAAALGAAVVLATFQHIPYVRIIQLLWWAWIGLVAALALPPASRPAQVGASRRRTRLVVTATRRRGRIALAVMMAAIVAARIVLAPPVGPGWHPWERDTTGREFRWSRGSGRLPVTVDGAFLHLPLALFRPDLADDPATVRLTLRSRGGMRSLSTRVVEIDRPGWHVESMDLSALRGQNVWLEVEPDRLFSPARLWNSPDRRWLGVAVGRPMLSDSAAAPPDL